MATWRTTVPAAAVKNGNISLAACSFDLSAYFGGTSEADAPAQRIKVHFVPRPIADMWIYGDKKILTANGRSDVKEFFKANGALGSDPLEIVITEISSGEIRIEKV
jgi:hypothetical protein